MKNRKRKRKRILWTLGVLAGLGVATVGTATFIIIDRVGSRIMFDSVPRGDEFVEPIGDTSYVPN